MTVACIFSAEPNMYRLSKACEWTHPGLSDKDSGTDWYTPRPSTSDGIGTEDEHTIVSKDLGAGWSSSWTSFPACCTCSIWSPLWPVNLSSVLCRGDLPTRCPRCRRKVFQCHHYHLHYYHHYHHHQSLNREGRWGTADDFTTSGMVACFRHMVSHGTWRSPSLSKSITLPLSSNYEDIRPVMPCWHQLFHP